jgi:hypothetical protein
MGKSEIAKGRQGRRRTPNDENQNECSAGVRHTLAQAGGALLCLPLLAFFGAVAVRHLLVQRFHVREFGFTD